MARPSMVLCAIRLIGPTTLSAEVRSANTACSCVSLGSESGARRWCSCSHVSRWMNASSAENSRKPTTAAAPGTIGLVSGPIRSVASGNRSAKAVATRTPAANAMNGWSRWRRRMAAVPPSRVEKKGRIAKAISTRTRPYQAAKVSRRRRAPLPLVMVHDGLPRGGALVRADQPWGDAQLAGLYDAFAFDGDLPFYLELAREQGRRVLEIACGSGRVLVPLTRAGFELVGFDASPHMLALARAKLEIQPRAAGSRLVQS